MNPECPAAEDRDPPEVTRQKAALPVLPESLAPLAAVTVGVLQQRYLTAAFAGDTTLGGCADGRLLVRRRQSRAGALGDIDWVCPFCLRGLYDVIPVSRLFGVAAAGRAMTRRSRVSRGAT